jgi:hypothetical protein
MNVSNFHVLPPNASYHMYYQTRGTGATLAPWDFQKKKKNGWLAGDCAL